MRAVKDSLAAPLRAKWGKSEGPRLGYWHVSAFQWWAGEKVARSGGLIRVILGNVHEQAWKDHLWSLAAALLGTKPVSARRGWAGEKAGLFEHPA